MNPGQLVFDCKLGKVVEIVRPAPENGYWVRPLGRRFIAMQVKRPSVLLREIESHGVTSWVEVLAATGWYPTMRNVK